MRAFFGPAFSVDLLRALSGTKLLQIKQFIVPVGFIIHTSVINAALPPPNSSGKNSILNLRREWDWEPHAEPAPGSVQLDLLLSEAQHFKLKAFAVFIAVSAVRFLVVFFLFFTLSLCRWTYKFVMSISLYFTLSCLLLQCSTPKKIKRLTFFFVARPVHVPSLHLQ